MKPRGWHPSALAGAYSQALAGATGIGGYGIYTRAGKTKAVLSIGRLAGLDLGRFREGQRITPLSALRAVMRRRMEQVDPRAAASTTMLATGFYGGRREPASKIEIVWTPDQERTSRQFVRNVKRLAQEVAGDLAQREILVEWDAPRLRGRAETASPRMAPSPTSAKFCAWVRRHSRSARLNPRDRCYVKQKR